MCWQDVQISRAQTIASVQRALSGGHTTAVYAANYDRVRLIITAGVWDPLAGTPSQLRIYTGSVVLASNQIVSHLMLTPFIMDFKDWGNVLQNPLTVDLLGDTSASEMVCVEIQLTDPARQGDPVTSTPKG